MKIDNNTTTFQSSIKIISTKDFKSKVSSLNRKKKEVPYPWTPNDMRSGKKIFTTAIMDCIAGGIISGAKVTLFHLGTYTKEQAEKYNQKKFNSNEVERRLLENIDLSDDKKHGLIIGGFKLNDDKLQKIKQIFEKYKIPYTIFGRRKDVHYYGKYSLLYENSSDTWYIANSLTESTMLNGKGREVVVDNNKITYNTYGTFNEHYKPTRHTTGAEEYLKTQFEEVKLSKFDNFV